jgi:hypothetical protein
LHSMARTAVFTLYILAMIKPAEYYYSAGAYP